MIVFIINEYCFYRFHVYPLPAGNYPIEQLPEQEIIDNGIGTHFRYPTISLNQFRVADSINMHDNKNDYQNRSFVYQHRNSNDTSTGINIDPLINKQEGKNSIDTKILNDQELKFKPNMVQINRFQNNTKNQSAQNQEHQKRNYNNTSIVDKGKREVSSVALELMHPIPQVKIIEQYSENRIENAQNEGIKVKEKINIDLHSRYITSDNQHSVGSLLFSSKLNNKSDSENVTQQPNGENIKYNQKNDNADHERLGSIDEIVPDDAILIDWQQHIKDEFFWLDD